MVLVFDINDEQKNMKSQSTQIAAIGVSLVAMFLWTRCYAQESDGSESTTEANAQSIDELLLFFPSKFPNGD